MLFAPEHAEAILDFIEQWSHADRIVIHCVGGLSRSPAVGMAICELQDWPLDRMEHDDTSLEHLGAVGAGANWAGTQNVRATF